MALLVQQDHTTHMEQLREAAKRLLPLLCYTDEEIAKFIDVHRKGLAGVSIDSSSGTA